MKCCKCDAEMFTSNLTGNALYSLILTQTKKSVWDADKRCGVICHVCPDCGYIELYADKPKAIKP